MQICKVSSLYSPLVQIVISVKSFSISFPLAVTKGWSNGECLKQAVHLALGCTCPFSTPTGPCPQLAHLLLTLWGDRRQRSQVLCSTVLDGMFLYVFKCIWDDLVSVCRGWLMHIAVCPIPLGKIQVPERCISMTYFPSEAILSFSVSLSTESVSLKSELLYSNSFTLLHFM